MLDGWESMECVECHREIASEWASTLHAQAWIDQRYQDAIAEKRRPQSCYGCHIPQPLQLSPFGGKPRPRNPETTPSDEALHYGISCLSCHLGPDDTMLGPYESDPDNEISPAHKSMKGEAFGGTLGDALCINCHRTNVGPVIGIAKDFEVTRQADKGLSCVGCHMSQVERSAAIETLEDGTTKHSPVRLGRSHALQTPRDPKFLAEAFGLDARLTDTGAELLITNQAAHRIPGLKTRSMTFVVQALDVDGKVLGEASLLIDSRAYLPVDGLLPIDIASATAPAKLQVTATHDWIGVEAPVEFVNKALELK
ncbi:MAG: hypothetical protein ACI9C2_001218 [Gammaproteobacteria bacterium]|jgi:hypothetical protein